MDKRTLIFIFAMTTLFFAMHQWFDFGKRTTETAATETKTRVVISERQREPILLSPEKMAEYNIMKLYEDVELNQFASFAIRQDENFLALSWSDHLPSSLFVKGEGERVASSRRISLQVSPSEKGGLALYTLHPLAKINIPFIPDEGTHIIHMITFDGDKVYEIEGELRGAKTMLLDYKPVQNAIALYEVSDKQIFPYGIYKAKSNHIEYLDDIHSFDSFAVLSFPQDEDLAKDFKDQKYYVLENEYQQLVFSNLNGALAEINLPFQSEENTKSVVHPIEFDRIMEKNYVFNDTFPQFSYSIPDGKGGASDELKPKLGGYYPLLRRNLIGGGEILSRLNPYFYSCNVFEVGHTHNTHLYTLKRFEKNLIEFEFSEGNRRITKTYSFSDKNPRLAPYCIDLTVQVEGDARNLNINLGIPEVELISGNFSPTLKYKTTHNQKIKVDDIKPPKTGVHFQFITPDWLCNGNGFFGIILDPLTRPGPGFFVDSISGELAPSRITVVDAQYQRYPVDKYPGYGMHIPLPSKQGKTKFRIFAGPFDQQILKQVDQMFTNATTGYFPDYTEAESYHGFFALISKPFAKFLFILMDFFHSITHSWGISIILLTIALRLMLYPLNNWSMKSIAKMQNLSPKLAAIKEKYKKDPQREKLEIMNLYKKEKVNPLGGCLPMIIQLPFIFGLLNLLKSSFQLRGATFIPGWIDNLTAPDVVFTWTYPIPFIGNAFHLLPILLGGLMFIQQRITSKSKIGTGDSDQQKQQRSMGNIMTVVFTVLFYSFPSGLNIYWISTTALGILQQMWIQKKLEKDKTVVIKK